MSHRHLSLLRWSWILAEEESYMNRHVLVIQQPILVTKGNKFRWWTHKTKRCQTQERWHSREENWRMVFIKTFKFVWWKENYKIKNLLQGNDSWLPNAKITCFPVSPNTLLIIRATSLKLSIKMWNSISKTNNYAKIFYLECSRFPCLDCAQTSCGGLSPVIMIYSISWRTFQNYL